MTPLGRVLLGILGVVVTAAALWFALVVGFVVSLTVDCNGPHGISPIVEIAVSWAIGVALACLPFLVAISLLRLAVGRRWLRQRSWLAVPLVLGVVAMPVGAAVEANTPPPSQTCVPFSLH